MRFLGRILFAGDHGLEDGREKAAVVIEGRLIVRDQGLLDGSLCGGCDEFEAADEDADGLRRNGTDRERQDAVHELARDDVE